MKWAAEFDFAQDLEGPHHAKLNVLADIAASHARPEDLLLFLDSDAFPIAHIDRNLLGGYPLAAVRRDENMGEIQPHPCFCLTTVGFWQEIKGDWAQGYQWESTNGEMMTDGGGNLLGILRALDIEWLALLRSNKFDLDPLWFGVYHDVVYHHGAGSRLPVSYLVVLEGRKEMRLAAASAVIPSGFPILGRLERSLRYRWARVRHERRIAKYAARGQALSDAVFADLLQDDHFYERFTSAPSTTAEASFDAPNS